MPTLSRTVSKAKANRLHRANWPSVLGALNTVFTRKLHGLGSELSVALWLSIVVAIANLIWLAATTYKISQASRLGVLIDPTIPVIHICIALALAMRAVGLCFRNRIGLLLSTLGSLWIASEYGWWFVHSRQFLNALGVAKFSELGPDAVLHHSGGLVGATWWDLLVMAVTVMMLLWEATVLFRLVGLTRNER